MQVPHNVLQTVLHNVLTTERWRPAAVTLTIAALAAAAGAVAQAPDAPAPALQAAALAVNAQHAAMLSAAWAGERAVAVGDHGIILLSDDQGRSWKQASKVPFDGLLTSVRFVDAQHGWAVGHAGVILATTDGGNTWTLQRSDLQNDRPLFAVHFFDAQHGVAVGLWSLVLVTEDGGKTWTEQTIAPPEGARKADLNLLGLFVDAKGRLYASAEKGMVLRSTDQGRTWQYLSTGYAGSLWCGMALADGTLLTAGLRGSLYRSTDDGQTWQRLDSGSQASITALAHDDRGPLAVALDGHVLRLSAPASADHAEASNKPSFAIDKTLEPRGPLTAALTRTGQPPLLFSRDGPLSGR